MSYPKILYVKRVTDAQHEYFQVSNDQASLVGLEPVEVATYHLVLTKKWKRVLVPDWEPGKRSLAGENIRSRHSARKR